MKSLQAEQVAELEKSLSLPGDIRISGYLGTGGRAHVFRAVLDGDDVIVKVYRPEAARKYRDRYGVDIAEFEHGRNRSLYALDEIRAHATRPYRCYPAASDCTQGMVQEFIGGRTLKDLVIDLGHLPAEVLEAGYRVIRATETAGVHALDISSKMCASSSRKVNSSSSFTTST